jgi:organic radical activating enzyme
MNINDYEIFKKITYNKFINNNKEYNLSSEPYLDIVMHDHCNARCKFCVAKLVHKKEIADIEKQKKKIKYSIENLGVKEVLLLGGEPTLNVKLFDYLDYLEKFDLNKICITTNAIRLKNDVVFRERLFRSCITHINISYMNTQKEAQEYITGQPTYITINDLEDFYELAKKTTKKIRINNNCFRNNNDNLDDIFEFYDDVRNFCDSVKFSPLLKTDSFSTVNEVTEFNLNNILTDSEYDTLLESVINYFSKYEPIINEETFGFVKYVLIPLRTPIILNYNQHGKLREKVIKYNQINNLKLLSTGDLSLSWNREEREYFITEEE